MARAARHLDRHEAATAEAAHPRLDDADGKGRRHRRIHGIATPVEDVERGPHRPRMFRGDHRVPGNRAVAGDME